MYNSSKYVTAFKAKGLFPSIHDDIARVLYGLKDEATNVLDLGCSTGLLTQRVAAYVSGFCIGVDCDKKAIETARSLGGREGIKYLDIDVSTKAGVKRLTEAIKEYSIDTVVMRRVIPELHDACGDVILGDMFKMFYDAGVKRLVLEGRIETKRAVNTLSNHKLEAIAIIHAAPYEVDTIYRRCEVLKTKEAK